MEALRKITASLLEQILEDQVTMEEEYHEVRIKLTTLGPVYDSNKSYFLLRPGLHLTCIRRCKVE